MSFPENIIAMTKALFQKVTSSCQRVGKNGRTHVSQRQIARVRAFWASCGILALAVLTVVRYSSNLYHMAACVRRTQSVIQKRPKRFQCVARRRKPEAVETFSSFAIHVSRDVRAAFIVLYENPSMKDYMRLTHARTEDSFSSDAREFS